MRIAFNNIQFKKGSGERGREGKDYANLLGPFLFFRTVDVEMCDTWCCIVLLVFVIYLLTVPLTTLFLGCVLETSVQADKTGKLDGWLRDSLFGHLISRRC